jgi:hypothetical protein
MKNNIWRKKKKSNWKMKRETNISSNKMGKEKFNLSFEPRQQKKDCIKWSSLVSCSWKKFDKIFKIKLIEMKF